MIYRYCIKRHIIDVKCNFSAFAPRIAQGINLGHYPNEEE